MQYALKPLIPLWSHQWIRVYKHIWPLQAFLTHRAFLLSNGFTVFLSARDYSHVSPRWRRRNQRHDAVSFFYLSPGIVFYYVFKPASAREIGVKMHVDVRFYFLDRGPWKRKGKGSVF